MLDELLKNINHYKGVTDDSREVKEGFIFVAVKGLTVDGHDYIQKARDQGSTAIIGENDLDLENYIKVSDSQQSLGEIASAFYGYPSRKLKIIGVTGTDGKTTTTHLIHDILQTAGKKVGILSTINVPGLHVTNPEAVDLQKYLKQMVDEGCEFAVLEVTSHGIKQKRIAGVQFETAVLTNITHEHMDYHKSFEDYRDTKLQFFLKAISCVLNEEDDSFEYFKNKLSDKNIVSYSLKNNRYKTNLEGVTVNDIKVATLFGDYNAANILAAIRTAEIYHISTTDIKIALQSFKQLPGRLERIENEKGINIFVDFAHTPNSLQKVLTFLKENTQGKLIVVYGCASERDREKRKLMPEISKKLADVSIFTAEDPRRESVEQILNEMEDYAEQAEGEGEYKSIPERGEAIYEAIHEIARAHDTIVICGKGHEKSMAYNGIEYPWSDKEAVIMALKGEVKKIPWKN
jgi:UDP-N-acetylmuramoyl-L-alanyl-D-glutamate--2,6-diaminopimelate ligase